MDFRTKQVTVGGEPVKLTPVEYKILELRSKIERDGRRFIETERGLGYRFVSPG